jgi:uncharacterized protein (TIGR03089 family)
MTSPEQLFSALVASQPSRPFVTYYDGSTGERSELSVKSLANWVAKTHFLLLDEAGLGVGDSALVALPAHWISVPVLLGCWSAGLRVTDSGPADVAFVAGPHADGDAYAVNPEAAARGFGASPPPGTQDYVAAVRPQPDAWATVRQVGAPSDPAVGALSRAEVLDRARSRAAARGLGDGARLLWSRPWSGADEWIDAVVVPLVVGGSVVIVAGGADADRIAEQERISARIA